MLGSLRKQIGRPSPAMGVALIALFVSLGGTSYGLATGSIDGREIKDNSVTSKDIRNSTVVSRDVRNSSLRAVDFRPGELPAGAPGPPGPSGPAGPAGAVGPAGVTWAGADGGFDMGAAPEQLAPAVSSHSYSFTTPSAGRVVLEARTKLGVSCSFGVAIVGIYVDGSPLPGSGRIVTSSGSHEERGFAGLTNVLGAGPHTAALLAVCPDGNFVSAAATDDAIWTALLVAS